MEWDLEVVERAALWITLASALPLLAVVATAFAKASVLMGLLRSGLGGSFPLSVSTGLAALLALLVMRPVILEMVERVGEEREEAFERAWPVLEAFLLKHSAPAKQALVAELKQRLGNASRPPDPLDRVMAFLLTELSLAFQMGVLLLIPFLIVDLLVANTLTVLNFQLPTSWIALPFKLLLFLAADGWSLLLRGFMKGYSL